MRIAYGLVAAALVAASCAHEVNVRFDAAESLHRNSRGESTPVDVRVFYLKDRGAFDRASIESLWGNRYRETLGGDVIGEPRQYTVFASSSRSEILKDIPSGARYMGVMAMFTGSSGSDRRVSVSIDEGDRFVFELADDRLVLKK